MFVLYLPAEEALSLLCTIFPGNSDPEEAFLGHGHNGPFFFIIHEAALCSLVDTPGGGGDIVTEVRGMGTHHCSTLNSLEVLSHLLILLEAL